MRRAVLFSFLILACAAITLLPWWPTAHHALLPALLILLYLPRWPILAGLWILFGLGFREFKVWQRLLCASALLSTSFVILEFNFGAQQFPENATRPLVILTLNMGEGAKAYRLGAYLKDNDVDIALFQETSERTVNSLLSKEWQIDCVSHLCIASKWPFERLDSGGRNKSLGGWGSFVTTYEIRWLTPFQLANVHLETPRKALDSIMHRDLSNVGILLNTAERQRQAAVISSVLNHQSPTITAGDFNMVSISPLYRKQFSGANNSFMSTGFGFGYTKMTSYHGVRIDHILHNERFRTLASRTLPATGGDHKPLLSTLEMRDFSSY